TAAKRPLAFSCRTSFQPHRLSPRASRRRAVDANSATDAFPSEESRMTSEKMGSLMDVEMTRGRRDFLRLSAAGGAGLIIASCRDASSSNSKGQPPSSEKGERKEEETGGEVTATEDLMREHGVLRRALIVYSEAAAKLRLSAASVSPE